MLGPGRKSSRRKDHHGGTETTAEMAAALLFAAARRIAEADPWLRTGKFGGWLPDLFLGKRLWGGLWSTKYKNCRAARKIMAVGRLRCCAPPIRRRGEGGRVSRPVRGRVRLPRKKESQRGIHLLRGLRAMPALRE